MDGSVVAVLGDRKTGKSVFARGLLRGWARQGALAVYCTPNGRQSDPLEYGVEFSIARAESGERLPYAIALREDPEDVAVFVIRAATKFDVALLLDEAHETLYEGFSGQSELGSLFHRGRHLGVHLILVSQWPARIDKRIFRAATTVYWFRLHAHEDLRWVEQRWGETAAREIASLPDYHHLEIQGDSLPSSWRRFDDLTPSEASIPPEPYATTPDFEDVPLKSIAESQES